MFLDEVPLRMFFLFCLLLLLSAFFSLAETIYSSANKIRLKSYVEEGKKGAARALKITENFDQTLSTILVGKNLVIIAAATIVAQLATETFGASQGIIISTLVVTILVILFGEVLPKSLAKEFAVPLSIKLSLIIVVLVTISYPVTWVLLQLRKLVARMSRRKDSAPSITEEEIKEMVDLSEEEGVIDEKEKELVHRSLDFNDIDVREVLTPRTNMISIALDEEIEEIKQVFFRERFSRIPVYDNDIDNVVGILSERDFLTALIRNKAVDIKGLLRKPLFVVESMKISALLPELQKNKVHMAIVLDEYGGTAGLITLEDILEELVGDIWDEHDDAIKLVKQLDSSTYLFYADYAIDDFARLAKVDLPETTYHTLGGWLVEEFKRIPTIGEEFEYENLTMQIAEAEDRRIRKIKVKVH